MVNDTTCDNQHTALNISVAIIILYVMTWETAATGNPLMSTFNASQLLSPFLHITILSQFKKKRFILVIKLLISLSYKTKRTSIRLTENFLANQISRKAGKVAQVKCLNSAVETDE